MLEVGVCVFVSTHPTRPAHELPWDFWRFPVAGLAHLFIRDTGFELIAATEGLPAKISSLVDNPPTRGVLDCRVNQGVALIVRKTHDDDQARLRWDIDITDGVKSEYR